jgi:hypothetical protein
MVDDRLWPLEEGPYCAHPLSDASDCQRQDHPSHDADEPRTQISIQQLARRPKRQRDGEQSGQEDGSTYDYVNDNGRPKFDRGVCVLKPLYMAREVDGLSAESARDHGSQEPKAGEPKTKHLKDAEPREVSQAEKR